MDLIVYIQLIFLCVVNIIFSFSGIVLNILVIASIWKSSQLRKKLCHFMIMILSSFDLITVLTNYPGLLLYLVSWLTEDHDLLPKIKFSLHIVSVFHAFCLLALLVMNIERYLGAYHPIFHRTSVNRRRLLTLLAILLIFLTALHVISINDVIISSTHAAIVFNTAVSPFLCTSISNCSKFPERCVEKKQHQQKKERQ